MNATEAMDRLIRAFPRTVPPNDVLSLYREKLSLLSGDKIATAVETAIERHKYKSLPSIAELLAWARGLEPGKAGRVKAMVVLPPDEIAFRNRRERAVRNGDGIEEAFLEHVTRLFHAARWATKNGELHPSDKRTALNPNAPWESVDDLRDELYRCGMTTGGDTMNARPIYELAVPEGWKP